MHATAGSLLKQPKLHGRMVVLTHAGVYVLPPVCGCTRVLCTTTTHACARGHASYPAIISRSTFGLTVRVLAFCVVFVQRATQDSERVSVYKAETGFDAHMNSCSARACRSVQNRAANGPSLQVRPRDRYDDEIITRTSIDSNCLALPCQAFKGTAPERGSRASRSSPGAPHTRWLQIAGHTPTSGVGQCRRQARQCSCFSLPRSHYTFVRLHCDFFIL